MLTRLATRSASVLSQSLSGRASCSMSLDHFWSPASAILSGASPGGPVKGVLGAFWTPRASCSTTSAIESSPPTASDEYQKSQHDIGSAAQTGSPQPSAAESRGVGSPDTCAAADSIGDTASGTKKDLLMVFTCTVCDTRAAKAFTRKTYEEGVVLVRCPGCQNLHLISDRLGWFGQPGSVEDFLAAKGEAIRQKADGVVEVTAEDIVGWSK